MVLIWTKLLFSSAIHKPYTIIDVQQCVQFSITN